jgi:replicative DNA helicase
MNRFVWDLRHTPSGLTAPPGTYKVTLTVGGATFTQPLNVLIDPRLAEEGTTAADLVEQFDHNLRMRDLVAAVNEAVAKVRTAQTQLRGATGADAEKAKIKQSAEDFQRDYDRLSQAISRLSDAPIYIDDTSSLTVNQIRSRARRFSMKEKLALIVVDYMQLIEARSWWYSLKRSFPPTPRVSISERALVRRRCRPVAAVSAYSSCAGARWLQIPGHNRLALDVVQYIWQS